MTVYRTCRGCVSDSPECPTRLAVRDQLRDLGVTTIKWTCKDRVAKFKPGDPVWVLTVGDMASATDDHGNPDLENYPGHVVSIEETRLLVYIPTGAHSQYEDYPFSPKSGGHGFCKIPMARVTVRDGNRDEICQRCSLPASQGHMEGYDCAYTVKWRNVQASKDRPAISGEPVD